MRKKDVQQMNKNLFLFNHRKEINRLLNKWMSDKHYDVRNLLDCNSEYLMAFGEKSNGKSTAFQMLLCIINVLFGAESVLLRLYDEDFKKGRAEKMFAGVPNEFIKDVTNGKYDEIVYKHYGWYFAKYNQDEEKYIMPEKPFCHRLCILNAGSSFQFPDVEVIFFDEFIRKDTNRNVPEEFVEFQTVISTVKRDKTSLQILMAGNTVNYYSCYFKEMGLTNIRNQKQGTIDTYQYGESELSVSVEYCDTPIGKDKSSNKYFAFNNPKLQMITSGKWQLDIYPHLPVRYRPKDIILSYYIKFDDMMFQCDIVNRDNNIFTYIFNENIKTPDFSCDIIYMQQYDGRPNINRCINKCTTEWQKYIWQFFVQNKIFYQDNQVGDIIRAYLKWCLA